MLSPSFAIHGLWLGSLLREKGLGGGIHTSIDTVIPATFVETLRRIHARLDLEDVEWAPVGSLGLAIRGAPVEPNDIDLITDKKGAHQIEQFLQIASYLRYRSNLTSRLNLISACLAWMA